METQDQQVGLSQFPDVTDLGDTTVANNTITSRSSDQPNRKVDLKTCGVCGDKALGYNFNAVTCESCKAFFRRNALKNKEFRCPFSNSCNVDIITRRFCQKCRLKKCFDIGMKKEWIMSDDEKKVKKQKIEENRAKRKQVFPSHHKRGGDGQDEDNVIIPDKVMRSSQHDNDSADASPAKYENSSPASTESSPKQPDVLNKSSLSAIYQSLISDGNSWVVGSDIQTGAAAVSGGIPASTMPLLSSLIDLNFAGPNIKSGGQSALNCQLHSHMVAPLSRSPPQIAAAQTVVREEPTRNQMASSSDKSGMDHFDPRMPPLPLDTMDSILNVAITAEFNSYSIRGGSNHLTRSLNDAERGKLNELIVANKALLAPVDEDGPLKVTADNTLINVINLTDIAIRRLIKMAKKIHAFMNLCQEDQVALLKGGCSELMILRSVVTYDPDRDVWKLPHSHLRTRDIKLDVLKEARGNLYEEHQRFNQAFQPQWRSDENIMVILSAIALFTPERPNIVHGDVIKLEQDSYYYLLRRYLESVYSGCEARSAYLQLIRRIAELHILNENHVQVFLDVNPRDMEPLLIEIFDLKHH